MLSRCRSAKLLASAWWRCLGCIRICSCSPTMLSSPRGGCEVRTQRPCLQDCRRLKYSDAVMRLYQRLSLHMYDVRWAMTIRKCAAGAAKARGLIGKRARRTKLSRSTGGERCFNQMGRDGKVVLPPSFADLRLGQRIYFSFRGHEFVLSLRPRRTCGGRLLSSRVRHVFRSLASFGPRARGACVGM